MHTIKIFYEDQETGPAQLVGRRVARIIDSPIFNLDLCRDSIVLLDAEPSDDNPIPHIKKILHSPYCQRTPVKVWSDGDAIVLINVCALLRAEAIMVHPPKDDEFGMVVISHHDWFDPIGLAMSIGIDQDIDDDDDEEDEDEEDIEPEPEPSNHKRLVPSNN